jgi:KUP system potassium uptake protein
VGPFAGAFGALGVVFGDIGTSPLYALRESLGSEKHRMAVTEAHVLGVLSLMLWAMVLVVTIKYLVIVMRADNHGEGGILALTALVNQGQRKTVTALILAGLFGTAMLYGDGMITPAISVLSAVEGVREAAPSVESWVRPISAVILLTLFSIQSRGTATIGVLFGPVMAVWFGVLAALGLPKIVDEPGVFRAVNPLHGVEFLLHNGFTGYLVLGSVFLVVTGGEALYADMGHFGRKPIAMGWYWCVLPALTINYLGQGALLLQEPEALRSPFYLLGPQWAEWPLTILATLATVIASQALITGAFSLTVQAINLDYLPRLRVVQTSSHSRGQVYVPAMNWLLCVACVALVFSFGSSSRLAAAYGIAVTLTMVITTALVAQVARRRWNWSPFKIALILVPLLAIDSAFAVANLFKIPDGGWFPLIVGILGFIGLTTWHSGRVLVADRLERTSRTVEALVAQVAIERPTRQPGIGVYLHRLQGFEPPALTANLRLNNSLHEEVVLLSVVTTDDPEVPADERAIFTNHDYGIHELVLRYGFVESPEINDDLARIKNAPVSFEPSRTTYFLGRERLDVTSRPGMAIWREHLFTLMHRNAADPAAYFHLPNDRTMDIGTYVEL